MNKPLFTLDTVTNITLVGVGGQGILLTADVLARTAALAGLSVKKSEIHGMSQRGGSVSSQVRIGRCVFSPIVPDGETDLLVSFDRLEAVRAFSSVRPNGYALVDACYLEPVTVSSGLQPAPADPEESVSKLYGQRLIRFDSHSIALQVGNARTANMAIAGALSNLFPWPVETWHEALRQRLPEKLLAVNEKAFDLGRASIVLPAVQ
ncbi:MAG: indolepyruvate oxidoreductase subunit beta [Kiritimatiellia bacterium]